MKSPFQVREKLVVNGNATSFSPFDGCIKLFITNEKASAESWDIRLGGIESLVAHEVAGVETDKHTTVETVRLTESA